MQGCGSGALASDASATRLAEVAGEIRVYKVTLQPGQRTALHTHDMAHVTVPISNGTLQYYDSAGQCCGKYEIKCCEARVLQVKGDRLVMQNDPSQTFPTTHAVENVGSSVCEFFFGLTLHSSLLSVENI